MKNTNLNTILSTARGADAFVPMLTGKQSVTDWAKALATESVTTKSGREISAARAALNSAQFAMTNMAMSLRCATELGMMPYTLAVKEANRIYTTLDALRSGFAGVRNEAHRELVVAELTLAVKDGAFDGLQSQDDLYTREELEELAREGSLPWDEIDDILDMQDARQSMGQSMLMDSDGSMAEDEGQTIVGVHDANQLWDMELRDILYAESSAAAVALIGKSWPTHNPMWESLLDRLADAWQAAVEYADDKEAMIAKVERREAVLEDLRAKPMLARWVINHVTRRVFRDMAMLNLKAEDVHARVDWIERQAMNEERYGVPANATRQGTGEHVEYERKAFLFYQELSEAEEARSLEHETQVERDRAWAVAQLEAIEALQAKLKPLYQELRALDLSMAKMWELFTDGERPAQPPVYWNMERAFLAGEEDAALAAIRIEAAMAKQKAREAEGDALVKAAAMVEQMLGL